MQTLEQIAQILTETAAVSRAETKRVFTTEKNFSRLNAYHDECYEVTVKGGFPVLVWMSIEYSRGDTDKVGEYIRDYEITTLNYSPVSFLKLTTKQQDEAAQEAFEKYLRYC
jgi:hypothetical protein